MPKVALKGLSGRVGVCIRAVQSNFVLKLSCQVSTISQYRQLQLELSRVEVRFTLTILQISCHVRVPVNVKFDVSPQGEQSNRSPRQSIADLFKSALKWSRFVKARVRAELSSPSPRQASE